MFPELSGFGILPWLSWTLPRLTKPIFRDNMHIF